MRGKLGLVEYFPDFVQLLHATKVEEIRLFWMVYLTSTYVKIHTRNIVFAFYVVVARNQNRKYNFG
jgi:hypothetical protein